MNINKELLLNDLCARLPYKPQVVYNGVTETLSTLHIFDMTHLKEECVDIKPYLRPMSSMTEEEKMYVNELIYDKDGLFLSPIPTWVINECDIDKYIDFCNSKHLDWRGLVSKYLALPALEGMYNF